MWVLVAIETVHVHLFMASAYGLVYCCFWASVCNIPLLISAIVTQCSLFAFLWWATDGIVDLRVVFQTPQQQQAWELLAAAEGDSMLPVIPKFVLDLDSPPSERWFHIVMPYVDRGHAERMKAHMVGQLIHEFGKVGAIVLSLLLRIILTAHARFSMPPEYREELLGIAKLTSKFGLSYFDLLQMNYGGSFVSPVHLLRNRCYWCPQQSLRSLMMIDIDFQKEGRTVFCATSWVFFVGTHTSMKTRHVSLAADTEGGGGGGARGGVSDFLFSISMNFCRVEDSVHQSLLRAVSSDSCHWPPGLLVRHVAEHAQDYHQAVEWLMRYPLLAPCSFSVTGSGEVDGVVMERDGGLKVHSMALLSEEVEEEAAATEGED